MNILPIISYSNYYRTQISPKHNNCVTSTIQNNSVSFGQALKFRDIFMDQLKKTSRKAQVQEYSNLFSAASSSIAKRLESKGVTYHETYNSISPIKSEDSYWSKVQRSGLDVRDEIRRTFFCKNAYDLTVLEDIIKQYNDLGYAISPINIPVEKMVEKGYTPSKSELKKGFVELPDMDIRFDRNNIAKFVPTLNGYISEPQKSGYEDIQLRFIKKSDQKNPNPIKHELIIIFGENYAKAKHFESEKIYKYIRQLNELKFYRSTKSEGLKKRTGEYIDAIKTKLNLGISQKLFASANSLDVKKIDNEMLINVSEQEIKELGKYFNKLREKGHNYYEIAEQRAKTPARLKKIKQEHEADSKLLAYIRKNLEESITFFNEKKYFKNLPSLDEIIAELEARKKMSS